MVSTRELISKAMVSIGDNSFKRVSGKFVDEAETQRFFATIFQTATVSEYATTLTVNGMPYNLDDFKVDGRLASLVLPRKLAMPGDVFTTHNLMECESLEGEQAFDPADFIQYQVRLLNKLRESPQFNEGLGALSKPKVLDDTIHVCNGTRVHTDAAGHVVAMPIVLKCAEMLYKEEYFQVPLEVAVKQYITSLYNGIVGKK